MSVPNSPYFHVVMPTGADPRASEKREIIRLAASSSGMEPHFPAYTPTQPGFNLRSALSDLSGCLFVLADFSFERPSCYYEVGLAEALKIPVYLIAEGGTAIHQTAARDQVRFYSDLNSLSKLLGELLANARKREADRPIRRCS